MQVQFGPGFAWAERVDVTGSGIGPRMFGALQAVSIDGAFTTKPLKGQYQMALAIARADQKISGKVTFAMVEARIWADIVFGATPATGQLATAIDEANTVPATTPWQVTVANAANFNDDLGVRYAASGLLFNRVTSPSAAGQYSVNLSTGVYTFGTADQNAAVLISYLYNNTTTGLKTTIANQLSGVTPQFKLTFVNPISPGPPGAGGQSLPTGLRLNACTASKLTLPYKVDDWMFQDLEFEAFGDSSNTVGYLSAVQ